MGTETGARSKTSCPVLLVFLALAAAACTGGEYPWLAKSVWWRPYEWTTDVEILLHFDEIQASREPESRFLSRGPSSSNDGDDILPPEPDSAPGQSSEASLAANSRPMGTPGRLLGAAALCRDGRFGGGLRLKGSDGALLLPGQTWRYDCTAEFWVRPDGLPGQTVALFHIQRTRRREEPVVTLELTPAGALRAAWFGKPGAPTETALRPGVWSHVAFRWAGKWGKGPYPLHAEIVVNGQLVQRAPIPPDPAPAAPQDAVFLVGNEMARTRGFSGVLDEFRLSHAVCDFHLPDLAWVDPRRPIRAPHAPPFIRDDADMTFHAPFDRTLAAARTPPGIRLSRRLQPRGVLDDGDGLLPGVDGQGLVVGRGGLTPSYEGEGILDMVRGSVAFWIRPLNWDNLTRYSPFDKGSPAFVELFHVQGDFPAGEAPPRWKGRGPVLRFLFIQNLPQGVVDPPEISPARWTHVAVTWDRERVRYYLDGKPVAGGEGQALALVTPDNDYWLSAPKDRHWRSRTRADALVFKSFPGGLWHPYWYLRKEDPNTILDDFRIYRRALAPAEVRNLVAFRRPDMECQALPPAQIEYTMNAQIARLDVEAYPLMSASPEVRVVAVSLRRQGRETPAAETTAPVEPLQNPVLRLSAPPLDFGVYDLAAEFRNARGDVLETARRQIAREKPPWWGNAFGLSDKVMPEWDPIKVAGNVVSVIHRDVHVAPSGWPARIISSGADLLAGPVRLEAGVGGRQAELRPGGPSSQFSKVEDVRVEWSGNLIGDGLRLECRASMEFDGLMWYCLTLSPTEGGQGRLDRLTLRVPLNPRDAELMHCWTGLPEQPPYRELPTPSWLGATPKGEGVVFRSNDTQTLKFLPQQRGSFVPYLCLMGMERGLAFFGENDRGWTPTMESPAISIERTRDSIDLVLNLISEPVALDGPRTIEFGLQPLPLRRLHPDWRRWPGWGVPFDYSLKGDPSLVFSLLPKNADWSAVAERWRTDPACRRTREEIEAGCKRFLEIHGREPAPHERMAPAVYYCLPYPGWVPEHTREFHEIWWSGGIKGAVPDRHFVDFSAWCFDQWAATGVVEGYYVDGVFMSAEIADRGNLAYSLPDGHVQPGFGWRLVREHMKRQRQTLWNRGITPHICVHMTNAPLAPILSFADVMLDGEWQYQSPPDQRDFLDVWPPDRLRVNHIGKWHIIPRWLGWTTNPPHHLKAWTYRHQRAWIAGLAMHDMDWRFWGPYSRVEDASELRLRDHDTTFIPYWSDQGLARHDHKQLYVCAWKAPRNGDRPPVCTVLLVNAGDARIDPAAIRLNTEAMGLGADPDRVKAQDVDPLLLDPDQYADDPTQARAPQSDTLPDLVQPLTSTGDDRPDNDLEIRAKEDAATMSDRKQHPDSRFTWSGGVLRCAVRRHDYRLIRFSPAQE